MTQEKDPKHLETETEEEADPSSIPEVAKKPVKFGPGQFQNSSKFGKGATHFNPPNKQRPGRAAGRGR